MSTVLVFSFFFFQAEDGIRDKLVTGVQTCALPISFIGVPWLGWTDDECRYCRSGFENLCEGAQFTGYDRDGGYAEYAVADARSEERRVGKECRSRWSPYH